MAGCVAKGAVVGAGSGLAGGALGKLGGAAVSKVATKLAAKDVADATANDVTKTVSKVVDGAAETAGGVDIAAGKFAQTSYSETFSKGGLFGGRTIDSVAGDLSRGALSPKDVPIDVIARDGDTLILNTRSAQALTRAGIPRGSWNVIDRTGQAAYEGRLSGQLGRNGLDSTGYEFPP